MEKIKGGCLDDVAGPEAWRMVLICRGKKPMMKAKKWDP